MYNLILYETASGRKPVQEFMQDLRKHNKLEELNTLLLDMRRLEEHGFKMLEIFPKEIKKLQGDIYELRPGRNRVLFFSYTGGNFILLHAFKKATQKTPKNEIDKAINEEKDYIRRQKDE